MSNHTENSNKLIIGSRATWLFMRIAQVFVLLIFLFFMPQIIHIGGSFRGIIAVVMLYTFAEAHRVAQGYSDSEGIHYKRYFTWTYVNWNHVQRITKQSIVMISVDLEQENFLNHRVVFLRNINLSKPKETLNDFDSLRGAWIRGQQNPRSFL